MLKKKRKTNNAKYDTYEYNTILMNIIRNKLLVCR